MYNPYFTWYRGHTTGVVKKTTKMLKSNVQHTFDSRENSRSKHPNRKVLMKAANKQTANKSLQNSLCNREFCKTKCCFCNIVLGNLVCCSFLSASLSRIGLVAGECRWFSLHELDEMAKWHNNSTIPPKRLKSLVIPNRISCMSPSIT